MIEEDGTPDGVPLLKNPQDIKNVKKSILRIIPKVGWKLSIDSLIISYVIESQLATPDNLYQIQDTINNGPNGRGCYLLDHVIAERAYYLLTGNKQPPNGEND